MHLRQQPTSLDRHRHLDIHDHLGEPSLALLDERLQAGAVVGHLQQVYQRVDALQATGSFLNGTTVEWLSSMGVRKRDELTSSLRPRAMFFRNRSSRRYAAG